MSGDKRATVVAVLADLQDVDRLRGPRNGSASKAARADSRRLPGDDHVTADLGVATDVGHDEHRPPALQRQPLGEARVARRPSRVRSARR